MTDPAKSPRCKQCSYPLHGLIESRCPECGTAFDLSDPTTFSPPPQEVIQRDRTLEEVVVITAVAAALAIRRSDMGEWLFQVMFAAVILFALALYYAVINDRLWLAPILFFVGSVSVCWSYLWQISSRLGWSFFGLDEVLIATIIALLVTGALVCIKVEEHSLRKKGQSSRLRALCDRIARATSLKRGA